jgi:hypothetical protein
VENRFGVATGVRHSLEISIDAITIGPVTFDGDEAEATFDDEPLGELGAPRIELRRPVRRLAEEDETRLPDALEQRIEVGRRG